ncbi:MAG: hypothetical protein RDU24_15520 [Humidesulfovibrio sp.]|uniref:hypothetical protein n=1 Tax=Humidesulfovibrio sp. TaxID=2910988 RepID=UPI0027E860E5|nr:hypothetical protein [Humidesulfovibrio sp.]MDQ7836788.1 hypothetical protein [Humidesulfovibrio sp.]
MSLPTPGAIGAIVLLGAAVGYAVYVERRIAQGEIPRVGYSFKHTLYFGIVAIVLSILLSLGVYWWTADLAFAKAWLGILLVLSIAGVLKGLLAEYHHKKRGGRNLDQSSH